MRTWLALVLLASAGAAPALETARGLAAAGAPRLAIVRVEQLQPRETTAPRWAEWEALRLDLLVELKRNEEVIKRADALPGNLPPQALRSCLLAATRAAVAIGKGTQARAYAARLLWQAEPAPPEARAARLLVIDSYLAERQGEAAFRAMLRYEQDYRPLDRETATRFVEALLDLQLDTEAVNWLSGLENGSAAKLRLQLRAGLITPAAAISQARAQLARHAKSADGAVDYWQVLAEAAARQGNEVVRVEALERLLNRSGGFESRAVRAKAQELWQAYLSAAQAAANRDHLLTGDDNGWAERATRRQTSSPQESRALAAYLVHNGAAAETRLAAQVQFATLLQQGGLDYTALHLFNDAGIATDTLDRQVRYQLGEIAEARNAPALAVRFWQGLPVPPKASAAEWYLRLATMQWRAGAAESAVNTVRGLEKAASPLPDPAIGRALSLAREMIASGRAGTAEETLLALQPLALGNGARDLLFVLGDAAESATHFERAADYYLRSFLARGSQTPDARAVQARLSAALNLARAGFREDARAQFQWVIGHSRDAAQLELARRELARL